MTGDAYDFGDFDASEEVLSEDKLKRLTKLAQTQLDAEARVEALKTQLEEAVAVANDIRLKQVPDLMDELGISDFTLAGGVKIEMGEEIRASIPKGEEDNAFGYLEAQGDGGLIKRQIVIEFGRDEEKWADKFERDCAQRKKKLNLARKKTVHASTLRAYVKSKLEEGADIPIKTFGVFRQRFSRVRLPKA